MFYKIDFELQNNHMLTIEEVEIAANNSRTLYRILHDRKKKKINWFYHCFEKNEEEMTNYT